MTLAVRNTVLILGAILSFAALVAFGIAGSSLLADGSDELRSIAGSFLSWHLLEWSVEPEEAIYSLIAAGLLALISFVALSAAARLFRRVNSAEIYFLAIFLLACCAEMLRIAIPLAQIQGLPIAFPVLVTRAVIFARIVGSLSIFAASIYAAGADYPRIGTISAILVALGFVVTYFMPIDNSRIAASFLFETDRQAQLDLILGFLSIGSIVNFTIGWYRGHRDQSVALVLAAAATVLGREIVIHLASPGMLASGLILVGAGVAGIIFVNRSYYLWT